MGSIRKEILTKAGIDAVWSAIRDVGALHTRLVPGFVTFNATLAFGRLLGNKKKFAGWVSALEFFLLPKLVEPLRPSCRHSMNVTRPVAMSCMAETIFSCFVATRSRRTSLVLVRFSDANLALAIATCWTKSLFFEV